MPGWEGKGVGLYSSWFLTQVAWVFYPEEVLCTQGSVRWEAEHRSISPEKSFTGRSDQLCWFTEILGGFSSLPVSSGQPPTYAACRTRFLSGAGPRDEI